MTNNNIPSSPIRKRPHLDLTPQLYELADMSFKNGSEAAFQYIRNVMLEKKKMKFKPEITPDELDNLQALFVSHVNLKPRG